MNSSDLSTPKNSVEISKLETEFDIPVKKTNWPTNSTPPGPPKHADYRHDLSNSEYLDRLAGTFKFFRIEFEETLAVLSVQCTE